MSEIVNLRRFRKAKSREEAAKVAAENRVRFGASKSERQTAQARVDLDKRRLDGHLRPDDPSRPPGDAES